MRVAVLIAIILCPLAACASRPSLKPPADAAPFTIVLGIAQDGGVPQAGSFSDPRWDDPRLQRKVVSLGIVDPRSGKRWMIDATPDFRRQLLDLHRAAPAPVGDAKLLTRRDSGSDARDFEGSKSRHNLKVIR